MPEGNGNWVTAEEFIRKTLGTVVEEIDKLKDKQIEQCIKIALIEARGYFWPSVVASVVGGIIILIVEFIKSK